MRLNLLRVLWDRFTAVMPKSKPDVLLDEEESECQESERDDEFLPLLPSSKMGHPSFAVGGTIGMTILISFATVFAALVLLSMLGGVGFVTKQDFTANIAGIATVIEQVKADVAKNSSDISTATQTIPNTIAAQVNVAIKEDASQWNSEFSRLGGRITVLEAEVESLNGNIADYKGEIVTLKQEITNLRSQYSEPLVVVDEVVSLKIIVNGIASPVPLKVTNNSDTAVSIPVRLTLVTTSSGILISNASMSGTYSVSISGSNVTFLTTAEVGAGSTVTFNIWVALNYTGISPNIWSASWDKQ